MRCVQLRASSHPLVLTMLAQGLQTSVQVHPGHLMYLGTLFEDVGSHLNPTASAPEPPRATKLCMLWKVYRQAVAAL